MSSDLAVIRFLVIISVKYLFFIQYLIRLKCKVNVWKVKYKIVRYIKKQMNHKSIKGLLVWFVLSLSTILIEDDFGYYFSKGNNYKTKILYVSVNILTHYLPLISLSRIFFKEFEKIWMNLDLTLCYLSIKFLKNQEATPLHIYISELLVIFLFPDVYDRVKMIFFRLYKVWNFSHCFWEKHSRIVLNYILISLAVFAPYMYLYFLMALM